MALKIDKEVTLPPSGIYRFSMMFIILTPLWFKIITLTIQADDEGPNTTDKEGAQN